ncbi:2-hydroxyacid dehydrogenase [Methylococcus sp. Mc7]|uniref:2-hydroxyacid dehydrogenase n=1 Tax=Methylococcus sp. Mc7 TaxID=2860258 RepID=UPI001C52FAD2|nr:2-hydroxyacid dehydrogenase [Methylococcus sp. Mc7]QXP85464.1 hydroxyacid dehydrogenase [Methylococcus sp. Mc7]
MLKVHLNHETGPEHLADLQSRLDPGIRLSTGECRSTADFDILVSGEPTAGELEGSPRLRAVIVPWVGVPLATLDLMREFPQIALHNLPYNIGPTAEMAVALLLAAAKRIVPYDQRFRQGYWSEEPSSKAPGSVMLDGGLALILGYGRIGRRIAAACRGLGMRVAGVRRSPGPAAEEYAIADLPGLLPHAAALVVCLPHTHETDGLIGWRELELLPANAVLVNVARGGIVEEAALYRTLKARRIYAAGIDVWYRYPSATERKQGLPHPPSAFPFHELDNVVMSPHRAGWSKEKEPARIGELANMLNAAARGEPMPYRVDPQRGY